MARCVALCANSCRTLVAACLALAMATALGGCGRSDEPARTPLPTRQTTIDPVKNRLDAAAKDAEQRRRAVDDAAK